MAVIAFSKELLAGETAKVVGPGTIKFSTAPAVASATPAAKGVVATTSLGKVVAGGSAITGKSLLFGAGVTVGPVMGALFGAVLVRAAYDKYKKKKGESESE